MQKFSGTIIIDEMHPANLGVCAHRKFAEFDETMAKRLAMKETPKMVIFSKLHEEDKPDES